MNEKHRKRRCWPSVVSCLCVADQNYRRGGYRPTGWTCFISAGTAFITQIPDTPMDTRRTQDTLGSNGVALVDVARAQIERMNTVFIISGKCTAAFSVLSQGGCYSQ